MFNAKFLLQNDETQVAKLLVLLCIILYDLMLINYVIYILKNSKGA